jgi:hypothetical protein
MNLHSFLVRQFELGALRRIVVGLQRVGASKSCERVVSILALPVDVAQRYQVVIVLLFLFWVAGTG